MNPVYAPGPNYPTVWERVLPMMGRKNKRKQKPQKPRKVKGRRKPPHKGGNGDKKGWLS